jgi:hypothetical protein
MTDTRGVELTNVAHSIQLGHDKQFSERKFCKCCHERCCLYFCAIGFGIWAIVMLAVDSATLMKGCEVSRCYDIDRATYFDAFMNSSRYDRTYYDLYDSVEIVAAGSNCCGMGQGTKRILKKDGSADLHETIDVCQAPYFMRLHATKGPPWDTMNVEFLFTEPSDSTPNNPKVCVERNTYFGTTIFPQWMACNMMILPVQKKSLDNVNDWIKRQTSAVGPSCTST